MTLLAKNVLEVLFFKRGCEILRGWPRNVVLLLRVNILSSGMADWP